MHSEKQQVLEDGTKKIWFSDLEIVKLYNFYNFYTEIHFIYAYILCTYNSCNFS